MAENAVKLVAGKLEALLSSEAHLLLGVEDQIKSLRVKLLWIQSFLRDAEERRRENERINVWVGLMRELAYDAEDVIDQYFLRIEQLQLRHSFYTRPIGWMKEIPRLHVLAKKMENINARFQEIVACKSHFSIENIPTEGTSSSSSSIPPGEGRLPQTSSYPQVAELHPVGLEDAVESLTNRLTDPNVRRRAVISIVGMGGSGKTTLARRIYTCADVTNQFQSRAWISVSQNFSAKKVLLQGITEGFMGTEKKEMDKMSEQQLIIKIRDWLTERKYLLIVDDIWRREAWDCIKHALPNTQQGSRVMLTTRIIDVAEYADSNSVPYKMETLDKDQSWELFCTKALPNAVCPNNLKTIGRDIVSICDGLPLAIVVIGALLRRKESSYIEWKKVYDRMSIEFREGKDHVQKILALSYDALPHHLKSCFLYIAIFPEDDVVDADKLIRLWIAEGFIQQKQKLSMEEVAEDFLEDLINRSMIQLHYRNIYGRVETIQIHDLLRDFALSEAKEINFLDIYDQSRYLDPSSNSRRLAIFNHIGEYNSLNLSTPKLRSLLYTGPLDDDYEELNFHQWIVILRRAVVGLLACQHPLHAFGRSVEKTLFGHWAMPSHGSSKLLRVLDIVSIELQTLPKEIGDMIQLRYLGLASTNLLWLPSSVGNLCNLQTLDIRGTLVRSLPKAFWMIQTLRHVLLNRYNFQGGPQVIGKWNNLQTLEHVRCGGWVQNGLARARNLRRLEMVEVSHVNADVLVTALEGLDNLVSLGLQGKSLPVEVFTFSTHQCLQNLELHGPLRQHLAPHDSQQLLPNLRGLQLDETQLEQDDFTILAKLPELRLLCLDWGSCKGRKLVFPTQGFSKLEQLKLSWMLEVETLEVEHESLASLRELKMFRCENLSMLPEGIRHLTSLVKLEVEFMPTIASRMRVDGGEDYDKIHRVRSILVDQKLLSHTVARPAP